MTAVFVLAVAALLVVVCSVILLYARSTAERTADAVLRAAADRISHDAVVEGPQAGFEDELPDFRADNIGFLILDRSGKVLRHAGDRIPPWPRSPGDAWRTVTLDSGPYKLVVGMPWIKTSAGLRSLGTFLLVISLCVVAAVAIGAWLLVGKTLSPIDALSSQASTASSENLRVQLHAPSRDAEVVRLVGTLNGLLARLAETAAARGRFYAAASHELRTPLHALQGHLELVRTGQRTVEEYQTAIDEAYWQARRLSSLVQALLLLNQLEAAHQRPALEPANLTDICSRVLHQHQRLVEERRLKVRADLNEDISVLTTPTHADMLVRNLIENALKYAAPGGSVCLRLAQEPGGARMELFNECTPLSAEARSHLFEPFYRPDGSRNSATGGNGLGLAICKAIADSNGWGLALPPDPDGFRILVQFSASRTGTERSVCA